MVRAMNNRGMPEVDVDLNSDPERFNGLFEFMRHSLDQLQKRSSELDVLGTIPKHLLGKLGSQGQ